MGALDFTGIKVFSTTLARDREQMGENITKWIKENPNVDIVDPTVTQSSDKEFPLSHHHALLSAEIATCPNPDVHLPIGLRTAEESITLNV